MRAPDGFLPETEQRNPRTVDMDTLSTIDLVRCIHEETRSVHDAVSAALPNIAAVIDAAAVRLAKGGRLIYAGAGTSGRLGVLDASECPPTFGVNAEMVQGMIAGGLAALTTAVEGAEDSMEEGRRQIQAKSVSADDMVIGIASSGRTPYVRGVLRAAREAGACTALLTCVSHANLAEEADYLLVASTGPEPLTGSTRMKAGTAQKLVLNMISTGVMVKLGRIYQNLMVDLHASNLKLKERSVRIVMEACGAERDEAAEALQSAEGECKTAIVMLKCSISPVSARALLKETGGFVRKALAKQSARC